MPSEPKGDNPWQQVGRYLGLATLLPACVLAGYIIGYLLDRSFGTTYLKIVFLFVGIAAGIIQLIRELMREPKS